MGDLKDMRGRQRLAGAASILVLLAGIEIAELLRSRWPMPPWHLLLELAELSLLIGAAVALATLLASRGQTVRAPLDRLLRHAGIGRRRSPEGDLPLFYMSDDEMELLQRLQFYGAAQPGHRVHRVWLRARCTDRLARHIAAVAADAKERGLIEDANGWLSLTPAGHHEIEKRLFLSPMEELTRR